MDRADLIDTTRRVLKCLADKTLETAPDVESYPSSIFTDAAVWRRERERLFLDIPHVVGYASEVAHADDYLTRDVAGVPVLVVRDTDGVLRAFLNACGHRGARVAVGSGCAKRFTCGYHSWTYDSRGQLASIPAKSMFSGMDRDQARLQPLPVSDEAGLIVVGLRPHVEVAGWLDSIRPALADCRFDTVTPIANSTVTVAANWKLSVDVNFEGYHFPAVHPTTLHPIATGNASYDLYGQHCRWAFPMRHIEELQHQPEDEWPEHFVGTVVYFFYPSCVLVEAGETKQLLRIYPGTHPGESIVDIAYSVTSVLTEDDRANHLLSFQFVTDLLCNEDFPMAEQCQAGLVAGRDRIVVGRNEPLLQHLHHLWAAALTDHGPVSP